jgi:hypothetical protein
MAKLFWTKTRTYPRVCSRRLSKRCAMRAERRRRDFDKLSPNGLRALHGRPRHGPRSYGYTTTKDPSAASLSNHACAMHAERRGRDFDRLGPNGLKFSTDAPATGPGG